MTTTTKHTRGPWQVWNYRVWTKKPMDEMVEICSLRNHTCWPDGEDHANGRLISLAPELAEALREVVETLGRIKAFGDDIGPDVSKAKIGAVRHRAKELLARIDGEPDLDSPEECAARDAREEKRLADFDACHRTEAGK